MKVSLKKETNIIDVPEADSVRLVEITRDGHFKYDVSYIVDPQRAIQANSIIVEILASTKPFFKQPSNVLSQMNPDIIIKNLLQKTSVSKDKGRSQKANVFFTYKSDISSKIPNDKASKLSGLGQAKNIPSLLMKTDKLLKLRSVLELTDANVIMPVLENNLAYSIIPQGVARSTGLSKFLSHDLITRRGIDPARISGTPTKSIQSAKKVSSGVIASPTTIARQTSLSEQQRISFLGNLAAGANLTNHLQLSPQDLINVVVDSPRTTIDIKETLEIPTELIQGEEFYFIFRLVNNVGVELQTINLLVPHARNVSNLNIPTVPPKMLVLQTGIPGKNVVNIKQEDRNATGVAVYRKEIKQGIPNTDASYIFIGNLEVKYGQDFRRLEDRVNNLNAIIYRAIPFNSSGGLSAEFESTVSKGIKPKTKKYEKRRNFVSVVGQSVPGAISLEIRDIPSGVCLVSVLKKNLTNHQSTYELVAKPTLMPNADSNGPIFIVDNDIKENKIYEYIVKLLYLDGDVEIGANNLTIDYKPVSANIVETSATKPKVVTSQNELDVQFSITSSPILGGLDLVKKALEEQGLIDYFNEEIYDEKDKLQNLLAYNIVRTNITTGEVEDFGTISEKDFSDRKHGKSKGVKDLAGGNEYRYQIITYLRRPETTLEYSLRNVKIPERNITYNFAPAKWRHPIALNRGTLTTELTRRRNHAGSVFTFGAIGSVAQVNVSLADVLPSVPEAVVQKLGTNSTLLQWRVQGQVTKIDHFIILLEMLGMRTVVGKCHNISDTNFFQFVDKLENGEHGKLKYYIVPVFYDYSRGTEVSSNEVIV
jgi:hypothetical protein